MAFRIGSGFDLHRLTEGIDLIIGGIVIPHSKGSLGHSDGDVLIHAICDAILGALNKGDLGKYLPSSDENIAGMSSMIMLETISKLLNDNMARIVNIDATLILQEPQLSPHMESIKSNLSSALSVDVETISVKSKTADHLGVIGREEGIAALCSVLIEIDGDSGIR